MSNHGKDRPLFTVIIPTFNRAELLRTAIESVIHQSFENWELVVIDDGSTDHTSSVVASFTDNRVRYYYQHNQDEGSARNHGILRSNGIYICFLDSDDYYLDNHLENISVHIHQGKFPKVIYRTGMLIRTRSKYRKSVLYSGGSSFDFFWNEFTGIISLAIHHELLREHRFTENHKYFADCHLEVRLAKCAHLIQLPEYTVVHVRHQGNKTESNGRSRAEIMAQMEDHLGAVVDLYENYRTELQNDLTLGKYKRKKALILIIYARKFGKRYFLDYLRCIWQALKHYSYPDLWPAVAKSTISLVGKN